MTIFHEWYSEGHGGTTQLAVACRTQCDSWIDGYSEINANMKMFYTIHVCVCLPRGTKMCNNDDDCLRCMFMSVAMQKQTLYSHLCDFEFITMCHVFQVRDF